MSKNRSVSATPFPVELARQLIARMVAVDPDQHAYRHALADWYALMNDLVRAGDQLLALPARGYRAVPGGGEGLAWSDVRDRVAAILYVARLERDLLRVELPLATQGAIMVIAGPEALGYGPSDEEELAVGR
jgi:hypothetical protein